MISINIHAFHIHPYPVIKVEFAYCFMFLGQATSQVHLIHLDGHSSIKHFSREREGGLIHVDCAYDNEILRDGKTLAPFLLQILCTYFVIIKKLVYQILISFRWFIIHNRISYNLAILLLTAFNNAQELSEVLLHRSQVHLIQTQEVRSIGVEYRLHHESKEWPNHILFAIDTAHIPNQL